MYWFCAGGYARFTCLSLRRIVYARIYLVYDGKTQKGGVVWDKTRVVQGARVVRVLILEGSPLWGCGMWLAVPSPGYF